MQTGDHACAATHVLIILYGGVHRMRWNVCCCQQVCSYHAAAVRVTTLHVWPPRRLSAVERMFWSRCNDARVNHELAGLYLVLLQPCARQACACWCWTVWSCHGATVRRVSRECVGSYDAATSRITVRFCPYAKTCLMPWPSGLAIYCLARLESDPSKMF